jgi:hypothetical protein
MLTQMLFDLGTCFMVAAIALRISSTASDASGSQFTNYKLLNYKLAAVLAAVSLAPLVPWSVRNYRTFHVFQPLVTFAATEPGEFHPAGWDRWVRTWMIDYVTMEDVTFHVSGDTIDISYIPPRAFDSGADRQRVSQLFDAYNQTTTMSPELDAQFADIARAHIRAHPLRYYLLMPVARLASMWLRPRTEMLPLDSYWWHFEDDLHDSLIASALGLLNLLLVGAALIGAFRALRADPPLRYAGLLLTFVVVRSLFMMYAGVAEPRYMLECYPVLFIFAAHALTSTRQRASQQVPDKFMSETEHLLPKTNTAPCPNSQ